MGLKRGSFRKVTYLMGGPIRLLLHILIFLLVWEAVASLTSSIAFPDVFRVARYSRPALATILGKHTLPTIGRVCFAYFVGTLMGLSMAWLMYLVPPVGQQLEPWVDFCRSMPGTAIFPFFLAYFGLGQMAASLPSAWVVLWITAFSTHRELVGAASVRLAYLERCGARWIFKMRYLHMYAVAKAVFGNARVCVSLALAVLVGMEMLALPKAGLGFFIKVMQEFNRYEEMMIGVLVTGVAGYLLNRILGFLEKRVITW